MSVELNVKRDKKCSRSVSRVSLRLRTEKYLKTFLGNLNHTLILKNWEANQEADVLQILDQALLDLECVKSSSEIIGGRTFQQERLRFANG